MDSNYAKQMIKAFYEGVREFGVEDALVKVKESSSTLDSAEASQIASVAIVSLITMIFPELVANEEFLKSIAETIEKMPKEEIDERVNLLIQGCEAEGI